MKAIVLLSGGIDSTVVLALAKEQGLECHAISFDYGQRHRVELKSAAAIAAFYQISHRTILVDPSCFSGPALNSSLTSKTEVPQNRTEKEMSSGSIPNTYVPARNTLFMAYAAGQAEVYNAQEIHFGPNVMDYHAYPDCRPEYFRAYQALINLATKQAVEGSAPRIVTPLIQWDKTEIIKKGLELKAPMHLTWSCYNPLAIHPCERCDACLLRSSGFHGVGVRDPSLKTNS